MPFLKLAFIAGVVAAVFGALGWALGWLALTFGYQSNDANLPVILVFSLLIFAALVGWLPSRAGRRIRRRLKHWWRGKG